MPATNGLPCEEIMKKLSAIFLTGLLTFGICCQAAETAASKAKWLWCNDAPNADNTKCFYRYTLNINKPVKSAEFVGYMDDGGRFFCNGKHLLGTRINEPKKPVRALKYNIAPLLKQGKNVIALQVNNARYTGGTCMLGKIVYQDGKVEYIYTDKGWKATSKVYKNFTQIKFDDSAWAPALEFGDVQQKPWSKVSNIADICTADDEKAPGAIQVFTPAVPATVPVLPSGYRAPSPAILPQVRMPEIKLSKSKWLWSCDAANADDTSCFYRYTLDIKEPVKSAEFIGYMDDVGKFFCNGKHILARRIQEVKKQVRAGRYIITPHLKNGKNIIALQVKNDRYTGGTCMLGKIIYQSGKVEYIHSTKAWKATSQAHKNFHLPEFDDSTWQAAVEFGDVGQKPWYNVSNIVEFCTTAEEKQHLQDINNKFYAVPTYSQNEKQRTLKIVWKNDRPALSDGKKEYPPEIFRFHFPSGFDLSKETDIMLKVSQTGYHIMETGVSSKHIERAPGIYDFSSLDRSMGMILKNLPDASIMVQLRIETLDEFLKKHPNEGIGYATGPADNSRAQKDLLWHSLDVGGRKIAPSYASLKFREELRNFVIRFAEYVKKQPWSKRLVAVRVTNGCYSEWHYFGMAGHMPDTGKAMTAAFKEFARKKYKTVEALRKAWHDNNVTFDTITVPGVEERWGKKRFLRNSGSVDRKVMDYYICHQETVADSLLIAAKAVKDVMPDMLVGTFYGYVFGMSGFPSEGQTLLLDKVLSSPYIDFLSSPYSYSAAARHKGGDGLLRSIPATFVRHKKLAINEEDTRTHLMPKPLQYTNVTNVNESVQIFLRDYALHSMLGVGDQLVDFGSSSPRMWFNDPKILTAIHLGNNNYLKIRENLRPQPNKIGVVFNTRELYLHGHPVVRTQQFNIMLNDHQIHALNKSGYPYDLMTLEDFMANRDKYSTVVFLNAFTLSDSERTAIKKRLDSDKSASIWIYAPGLVTENQWSESAMKELTGMTLKVKDAKLPMALNIDNLGSIGNAKIAESPRIYVDDKSSEAMGMYSDKTIGMAKKGNVIFSGVPVNKPEVWAALLKKSGAHAYTKPGIFVHAVNPFILVHVANGGSYPINLPAKARKVISIYDNNQTVAQNTDSIVLQSKGCKTWLLKVEYK